MNYRESIQSYINKIEHTWNELSPVILQDLSGYLQVEKIKKNIYILNAGEICKHIYVVQSGSLWKFHPIKGRKVPTEFAFQDDIIIPFQSYYLQIPSHEYIQALENSVIEKIEYGIFESLKTKHEVLQKLDNLFLELHILKLEERLYSLRFHTASEKIKWILNREPKLFEKVPLKHIASYLDLRAETLIRERKKLGI